ncbi:MAG: ribonuclease Z [Saprospiraceae bacterium]|nr:ribonuclease Z [Saprospiraceae bacterium]
MAKKFEVTLLGVNSAFPIHGRHPSCQIVNYDDQLIMIDCGEASQIQLSKYSIKKGKINHIFISHLHGDHCYGLPGLITSFSLQGRKTKLNIHGPFGLKKFLEGVFEVSEARFSFELNILEYNTELPTRIEINSCLYIDTFPMKHRIPTMGFRVCEQINYYNIQSEAIKTYALTVEEIKSVKLGQSIFRKGKEVQQELLVLPKEKERSYSYCSDTVYDPDLIPFISDSTLLYHETTYLDDLENLAKERMHSTLGQAIDIAKAANIDKMITGHYSSRYKNLELFLERGITQLPGLLLGLEGEVYEV